jgi:predicted N-acyltransferase
MQRMKQQQRKSISRERSRSSTRGLAAAEEEAGAVPED